MTVEYKVQDGIEQDALNSLAREGWRVVGMVGATGVLLERPLTEFVFGPWHSSTGDKYHFMPNCTFGQFSERVQGKGDKLPCEHCVGLGNIELGRPWEGGR